MSVLFIYNKRHYIMGKLKQLSNLVKYSFYLIILAVLFGIGFVSGRKSVKLPEPVVKTEYIKSDPIHDTLYRPKPVAVKVPTDTLDLLKACIADGIYKELWPKEIVKEYITKEDTSAILADWATERKYSETLFDTKEDGKFVLNTSVKYNRLGEIGYDFTPANKVITKTVYKTKDVSPFVGLGHMFNPWDEKPDPTALVSGGVFIHDKWGIQLQYQRGYKSNNDYLGGQVLFKF